MSSAISSTKHRKYSPTMSYSASTLRVYPRYYRCRYISNLPTTHNPKKDKRTSPEVKKKPPPSNPINALFQSKHSVPPEFPSFPFPEKPHPPSSPILVYELFTATPPAPAPDTSAQAASEQQATQPAAVETAYNLFLPWSAVISVSEEPIPALEVADTLGTVSVAVGAVGAVVGGAAVAGRTVAVADC